MIEVIQSSGVYAIILVVAIAVASLLGLVLFASREEKFEDVVAAQKKERDALIEYLTTGPKSTKGKKKDYKKRGKGRAKDDDRTGDIDLNVDAELPPEFLLDTPSSEVEPISSELPKEKEGQPKKKKGAAKKSTKKAQKAEIVVEDVISVEDETSVEAAVDDFLAQNDDVLASSDAQQKEPSSWLATEATQDELQNFIDEMRMEMTKDPTSLLPSQASKKTKSKKTKGQPPKSGEKVLSLGQLLKEVESSPLSNEDVQTLIDALFDKQNELLQWQKPNQKGEQKVDYRQQVQELQALLEDERKTSQLTAQRLKETRTELNTERSQSQTFQTQANAKIGQQGKEIQALQKRMETSHEKHLVDMQSAQTQIQRMQELIDGSSSVEVSRLKEEIAHLQKASMRVKQLMEDNKSLINELNQVQQNNKQLRAEVDSSLSQVTAYESEMSKLRIDRGEAENVMGKQLKELNERLLESETENRSLSDSLEIVQKELEELRNAQIEQAQQSLSESSSPSTDSATIQVMLDEATKEIGELKATLKGYESKLKNVQESEDGKTKHIMKLEAQLAEQERKLKAAESSVPPQVNGVTGGDDATDNSTQQSLKGEALEKLTSELKTAQEDLVKANEALQTIAKEKHEATSRLETEIARLKEQGTVSAANAAEELKIDIQEKKEELKRIEHIVEQLKTKNNELREKNWKAMDAVGIAEENAKKKVKELEATTIEFLESIHPDVRIKKNEPLSVVLEQYKEDIAHILTKNNNNDELESIKVENESLRSKVGDLENAVNAENQAKVEELEARLSKAIDAEKNISLQADHYKRTLEETETMLTKLKEGVEAEVDSWKDKNQALKTKLDEAHNKVATLEAQAKDLSEAREKIATLETQAKDLSEQIDRAQSTSAPSDLEKIRELEARNAALTLQVNEKAKENEQALSREKDLSQSCAASAAEVESLKEKISALEEVASAKQDSSAKDARIRELEAENSSLEEQLRDERDRVIVDVEIPGGSREELTKELSKAQEELEEERKAHGELKGTIDTLEGQLSSVTKTLQSKEEECSKAIEKAKEEEDRYKQVVERLAIAEGKVEELENQNLTKSQQIEKEINDAMTQLKTSIAEKDKALEAERQTNRQLRVQLASVTAADAAHGTSV